MAQSSYCPFGYFSISIVITRAPLALFPFLASRWRCAVFAAAPLIGPAVIPTCLGHALTTESKPAYQDALSALPFLCGFNRRTSSIFPLHAIPNLACCTPRSKAHCSRVLLGLFNIAQLQIFIVPPGQPPRPGPLHIRVGVRQFPNVRSACCDA